MKHPRDVNRWHHTLVCLWVVAFWRLSQVNGAQESWQWKECFIYKEFTCLKFYEFLFAQICPEYIAARPCNAHLAEVSHSGARRSYAGFHCSCGETMIRRQSSQSYRNCSFCIKEEILTKNVGSPEGQYGKYEFILQTSEQEMLFAYSILSLGG